MLDTERRIKIELDRKKMILCMHCSKFPFSFGVDRGEEDLRHSIDLEAGAQAIQASAAHAVQVSLASAGHA